MILISDEGLRFQPEEISEFWTSYDGTFPPIYHFQLNDGTKVTLSDDNLNTQIYKDLFTPQEADQLKDSGVRWKIVDKEDEI